MDTVRQSVPFQVEAKGEIMEKKEGNNCGAATTGVTWDNGDIQSCVKVETSSSSSSHILFDFHPGQMASIIRRKAMIKQLAASYHAECLSYCQELLELQRRWEQGK